MTPSTASIFTRRWAHGLKLAGAAVLVLATAGPSAEAQYTDESNPAVFWRRDRERQQLRARQPQTRAPRVVQRPTHLIRGAPPRRGYVREVPESVEAARIPQSVAPASPAQAEPPAEPATSPSATAAPPPQPGVRAAEAEPAEAAPAPRGPSFTIAVLGDNVGQMLAQGLQEAFADRPEVTVLRKARENTGLVRDDYYDWPKAARDLLAGDQRIDVAIMMIGSNDRQSIRDGATSVDVRNPRWKELYAARVQALTNAFKEKNTPLVWVGMPVMKNERLSAGLLEQNEVYRETTAQAGQTFVDVWEAFVDDRHQFALYGPDVNGVTTKLRTGDGVHFTRQGARKLAHFVEGDIKRLMDERQPRRQPEIAAPVAAAPADGAVEVRVVVPTNAAPEGETSAHLAIPLPPPAPAIVIPVRRAAGPVQPLTSAAVSPGGRLAGPGSAPAAGEDEARRLVEQALVQGRPPDARAGRADDFRWPRD